MPAPLSLPSLMLAQMTTTTQTGSPSPAPAAPATPAPGTPAPGTPAPAHQAVEPGAPTNTGVVQAPTTQKDAAPVATTQKDAPSPFGGLLNMLPIILMFVALYLFLFRGQKKEEKRRKSLLAEMKKGDKVQTIGGLVASVVSIDGDEVVLKVDESANVKAVYKKSAILNVITPAGDRKSK